MALIAKKTSGNTVPPLAADTYTARCIGIVDCGEQHNETFNNYSHKVLLLFEVCGETVDIDGEAKPRWLSKAYTLSLNTKSAMYKMITAWFNHEPTDEEAANGFDLTLMLNRPALLSVSLAEKEDRKYNSITAITAVPKSIAVPEAESELIFFDISEWDQAVFDKLPTWIQDRIKKSTEYCERMPGGAKEIDIPEEPEANGADGAAPSLKLPF
jgi:hypothetical protein